MSHRHHCDYAGHDWQCSSHKCVCICGVPMHRGDHSECAVELRACPRHQSNESAMPAAPITPSKGVQITIPPMHKMLRAARRASRPGFVGACLWCGHGYRRGQYSPAAQDAHMLECPSFPEEGKQQIREAQRARKARVKP
jgi:hypothetical protein